VVVVVEVAEVALLVAEAVLAAGDIEPLPLEAPALEAPAVLAAGDIEPLVPLLVPAPVRKAKAQEPSEIVL
jgi:hypothetical protein